MSTGTVSVANESRCRLRTGCGERSAALPAAEPKRFGARQSSLNGTTNTYFEREAAQRRLKLAAQFRVRIRRVQTDVIR